MSLKSEIRNNISHFVAGLIAGAIGLFIFRMEYSGIMLALGMAIGVESYQLIGKREPWWIIDRVCDILGYLMGGAVMTFIFVWMRWV